MGGMRVLVIVAHADDETLGCFSILSNPAHEVHVIHVTDSAPRDLAYARRAGFSDRESYFAARQAETHAALRVAGVTLDRYRCLGIPDLEAPFHWDEVRALVKEFPADRVYTHAFEGGHPDHDAVALGVAKAGRPDVWEFPLYHAQGADFVPQSFLEGAASEVVVLDAQARAAKRRSLECFVSQQRVIGMFPLAQELFRPQRNYDFTQPPHPGELYYERRKLGFTWAEWREATAKRTTL